MISNPLKTRSSVSRVALAVVMAVGLSCGGATAGAQQLDQTWTLTINGQTVQASPDGSFLIPNISAPDQFGPNGPGTRPDFVSDDYVRVIGHSMAGGRNRYAFSDFF